MSVTEYRPLLREGNSEVADVESLAESSSNALQSKPSFIAERVPPEWVLLLLGCAIGLTTGASVVVFNLFVHGIHNLAWAGTPAEGAAWLRVQPLASTWHRIMLIPVLGGVVVGVLHALSFIFEQSQLAPAHLPTQPSTSSSPSLPLATAPSQRRAARWMEWGTVTRPVIKAVQAAITLGTGSSLGPEGPSVDIGKAWAQGLGEVFRNTQQRKLALLAAGSAAGIASGFSAAVAGCFFAIETVLQVQSESAPPLTIAMILLASVLSSTVSKVVLGEEPAFTVPEYQIKSAAELPLYLLLGMVCGVISVIFTRLISWSTSAFDFLRDRLGVSPAVTPALGGLCVGLIALRYPGVLYWGFSNVNEILHSRESASAPGPKRISQLIAAKILATSLCKGSGLMGGIYAPSLFIGSAVGSVYGSLAQAAINAAISGTAEVAEPQAYALVGMAAMLASVCSVPLTSILLLFELTKDYRILLPLMGAVGLAFWVSSVANKRPARRGASNGGLAALDGHSPMGLNDELAVFLPARRASWHNFSDSDVELAVLTELLGPEDITEERLMEEIKVSEAMVDTFVTLPESASVQLALSTMQDRRFGCCLIVDSNDMLEGIVTYEDIQKEAIRVAMDASLVPATKAQLQNVPVLSLCSRGANSCNDLTVCYPDMSLKAAIRLMNPKGLDQLPVVARGLKRWQDRGRKVVGLVDRDSVALACKAEATKRMLTLLPMTHEGPSSGFGH